MLEWIIIGGGIQGCTVASFLLKSQKTTTHNMRIIDPHVKPLSNWQRMTGLIEMPFLRSPSVHHIDVSPFSLQYYAKKAFSRNHLYGDYRRPSLELFNAHCKSLLEETNLEQSWVQGRVKQVKRENDGWAVQTEDGTLLHSKNVVLAIGVTEQPIWPEWAQRIKEIQPSSLFHIFDEEIETLEGYKPPFTIIGGGITAAHLAIKLSKQFPGEVTLLTRHPLRCHNFDSDPGWLGQKYLRSFQKLECFKERREKIRKARYKGSMPKDVYRTLCSLQKQQSLRIIEDEIKAESILIEGNYVTAELTHTREQLQAQTIVLATGFQPVLPGEDWLLPLIEQEKLACAACGYPIVGQTLEWCSHLFVAGALAELEIGPTARNIAGARMAAQRIVTSAGCKS